MASSGTTQMSAPADSAAARALSIRSTLPVRSPTTVLSCAAARRRCGIAPDYRCTVAGQSTRRGGLLTLHHGTGRTVTTMATRAERKEVTVSATDVELSSATFDEKIAGAEGPVLVEFWAEWCPPCKVLAPILDEILTELGDGLRVYKVNSDEQRELSARFEVLAVPTILLFSGGELRQRLVGARSKARLLDEVGRALSS